MPTKRTTTFVIASLLLYLFANQTQVGWIYVMSAVLGGIVLAGSFLSRFSLGHIEVRRRIGSRLDTDLYEGDEVTVTTKYRNTKGGSAAQISAVEICPLAAPESNIYSQQIFIPSLPRKFDLSFAYDVTIYRRGIHHFPPVTLASKAPFGLFKRSKTVDEPDSVLIYPELHELNRLSLLDRQPTPELARTKAGLGSEVIGIRQYRSGDSPRHIHWRSVARTGKLVSKEFAEETRPGLTLILDLFEHPYPDLQSKHTPFEWSVKAALSIGDYAIRRGYPLHFAADPDAVSPLQGSITKSALLEMLARIEPVGHLSLPEVIEISSMQSFVAVVIPWPDLDVVAPLGALRRRGLEVLAAVMEPASFPAGGPSARGLADALLANDVEVSLVEYGEDWAEQLEPHVGVTSYVQR